MSAQKALLLGFSFLKFKLFYFVTLGTGLRWWFFIDTDIDDLPDSNDGWIQKEAQVLCCLYMHGSWNITRPAFLWVYDETSTILELHSRSVSMDHQHAAESLNWIHELSILPFGGLDSLWSKHMTEKLRILSQALLNTYTHHKYHPFRKSFASCSYSLHDQFIHSFPGSTTHSLFLIPHMSHIQSPWFQVR